jgi:hypothetical protein
MTENYFMNTNLDDWSVKEAFQEYEKDHPIKDICHLLLNLKNRIIETTKAEDTERALTATKLLIDWKVKMPVS